MKKFILKEQKAPDDGGEGDFSADEMGAARRARNQALDSVAGSHVDEAQRAKKLLSDIHDKLENHDITDPNYVEHINKIKGRVRRALRVASAAETINQGTLKDVRMQTIPTLRRGMDRPSKFRFPTRKLKEEVLQELTAPNKENVKQVLDRASGAEKYKTLAKKLGITALKN